MFSSVEATMVTRLSEAKRLLALAKAQEGTGGSEARALRGLVYVVLYGVMEHTVKAMAQIALQHIGQLKVRYADLNQPFFAVALDPTFTALAFVGADRKWLKRGEFLTTQISLNPCNPIDTLFDDQTMNVRIETLRMLFRCFCIPDPIVPDPRLEGLINDITSNRNDIAHGLLSPQSVGARRTTEEMERFVVDMERVLGHVLSCFAARFRELTFVAAAQRPNYAIP